LNCIFNKFFFFNLKRILRNFYSSSKCLPFEKMQAEGGIKWRQYGTLCLKNADSPIFQYGINFFWISPIYCSWSGSEVDLFCYVVAKYIYFFIIKPTSILTRQHESTCIFLLHFCSYANPFKLAEPMHQSLLKTQIVIQTIYMVLFLSLYCGQDSDKDAFPMNWT
jgi:hypothetical protein